ncbi:hypothetical protein OESDEN_23655 [Oesophagostomum dentatum]|uniref:Uncharacterized protein n=1 Tax=Oesophagostomum dentatum TaxID=61180 RepID=A0A0B1S0K7_OESDE|nr:hypothetical protein OESDEN_23655 [Oesophagostomum dentatum]
MKWLWVLLLVVASAFAADSAESADKKESKEKNYKKYIAEQDYVSEFIRKRLPFKTRVSEPFTVGQTIHAVGTLSEKPTR